LAVYYGQNSRNIVGAQGPLASYCQGILSQGFVDRRFNVGYYPTGVSVRLFRYRWPSRYQFCCCLRKHVFSRNRSLALLTDGVPPTSSKLMLVRISKHVKPPVKRSFSPWVEQLGLTVSHQIPKQRRSQIPCGISLAGDHHPRVPSTMPLSTGSIWISREVPPLDTPHS